MKERLLNMSDHVKIQGQLVLYQVINGKLYVAGKQVYDNLLITIQKNYIDHDGNIPELSNISVKKFVNSLFKDKVLKFHGNNVVNNWK